MEWLSHHNVIVVTPQNINVSVSLFVAALSPFLLTWFTFNPSMDKQSHAW